MSLPAARAVPSTKLRFKTWRRGNLVCKIDGQDIATRQRGGRAATDLAVKTRRYPPNNPLPPPKHHRKAAHAHRRFLPRRLLPVGRPASPHSLLPA